MRLKYQSLIALGISSAILSGCTVGSGFLNLGVVDALKESQANIFKQRLAYKKTALGNTGLWRPTFGTHSALEPSHRPTATDDFIFSTAAPSHVFTEGTSADGEFGCGVCECNAHPGTQYYMYQRSYDVMETPSAQIAEPPARTALEIPAKLIKASSMPQSNPLPNDALKLDPARGHDDLDSVESLEPLGQLAPPEDSEQSDQVLAGQLGREQSIFEPAAKSMLKSDAATAPAHAGRSVVENKSAILTLHARPAQSHNIFDRAAHQQQSLETMQAGHKRGFRQQNALRKTETSFGDRSHRQAMNNQPSIEFKPLPSVTKTTPTPAYTRIADATDNHTAHASPRIPILRATTVSSGSILSLKNFASGIVGNQSRHQQHGAPRRTANSSVSTSNEVMKSDQTTINR